MQQGVIVLHKNRAVYPNWSSAPALPQGAYRLSDAEHDYSLDSDAKYPYYSYVDVRALSASLMHPTTSRSLDTSYNNGQAVKDATPLFVGLPLKVDHKEAVDMIVGKVVASWWQDPQTLSNGITIPGGVNVRIALSNWTKVADGFKDGTIRAVSTTFNFVIEPTHPNLSAKERMALLGTVVDGKLVTRQVSSITSVEEVSAVQEGFDVFAKVLTKDNKLDMSNYLAFKESLSAEGATGYEQYALALEKDGKNGLPCVEEMDPLYSPNNLDSRDMSEETPEVLAEKLNKTAKDLEAVNVSLAAKELEIVNVNKELLSAKAEVTSLTGEKVALTQQVTLLTGEKESLAVKLKEVETQLATVTQERESLTTQVKAFADAEHDSLVGVLTHAHANAMSLGGTPMEQGDIDKYREALKSMPLAGLRSMAEAQKLGYSDIFWSKPADHKQEATPLTATQANITTREKIALAGTM